LCPTKKNGSATPLLCVLFGEVLVIVFDVGAGNLLHMNHRRLFGSIDFSFNAWILMKCKNQWLLTNFPCPAVPEKADFMGLWIIYNYI